MVHHAICLPLVAFGARAEGWIYDSRGGAAIYFILLLLAILAWLSFQLRLSFKWSNERQQGPLRLGIDDPDIDGSAKSGHRHQQPAKGDAPPKDHDEGHRAF